MKFCKKFVLGLVVCAMCLCGCQRKAEMAPPEEFELAGQKVAFAPPLESWGKKTITAMPHSTPDSQLPPDTVVSYEPTWEHSSLTVSGLSGWPQASWEADQEATNNFTRQVQDKVLKRAQGQILKQRQSVLQNEPALELEVRYSDASVPMHGKQIYAIHNNTMWIISLNVPEEQWEQAAPVYDSLVESWQFK